MQNSSALIKQEFLKKWIKALQTHTTSDKGKMAMTVSERKEVIKSAADVAIAATRNPTTGWSRAVIASTTTRRIAAEQTLGCSKIESKKARLTITRSNKILRRSRRARMASNRKVIKARGGVCATTVSVEEVKSRISVLKRLVPGGEAMNDEACLIKETLDYVAGLRVQVDVMRHILDNHHNS